MGENIAPDQYPGMELTDPLQDLLDAAAELAITDSGGAVEKYRSVIATGSYTQLFSLCFLLPPVVLDANAGDDPFTCFFFNLKYCN